MICAATKEIEAAFKSHNWNYDIEEQKDSSALFAGFTLKSGDSVKIAFISNTDNDVAIRVFQFISIPFGKRDAAIRTCNDVNRQFRFAKFVADDKNVGLEMDMPVETANIKEVVVELLIRLIHIAEDAYPTFRKALNGPAAGSGGNASGNSAERY